MDGSSKYVCLFLKATLAKQGSLAQSQHFDQLEALWNKRSPPRRRLQQVELEKKCLVCTVH